MLCSKNTLLLLVLSPKTHCVWFSDWGHCCRHPVVLLRVKGFECCQTCPSPTGSVLSSSHQHASQGHPKLACSKHSPFKILGRAGLGQAPVSTATCTLSGHYPEVVDLLPSRTKKSPPRRHVLTSSFRATGRKFLEDFQYILSLISPSGVRKC